MIVLITFAFIGGVITILSPCILPILPIVLSGSVGDGKRRPFGIVTGFILSFTFFTLFLTTIVKLTGVSADFLRNFSVVILILFGFSLIIPKAQAWIERGFSKFANKAPKNQNSTGFKGGMTVGLSLGLIWTPCVGPILASVISLALTETVSGAAFVITFAYAVGTALPMLVIIYGGRTLLKKVPWLLKNTGRIQKAFGVVMIIVAIGIFFNIDRQFQTYILEKIPSYGTGLTSVEDNDTVQKELDKLQNNESEESNNSEDLILAPEIIPGGQWFNSELLTLKELKGKVVLIDFWTYTCINCIRTLPYLQSWHEKYADDGLVIIGVHTPEFEFEKNPDNVAEAIEDFGLTYAVVQDNNYATWRAYSNRYWPAKYFINKNGEVVSTHFGEGKYDESEEKIQELLAEINNGFSEQDVDNPTYVVESKTPELYLGALRMSELQSPEQVVVGELIEYSNPDSLESNKFSYDGVWIVEDEYSSPSATSSLTLNYSAGKVFLVMSPTGESSIVKVLLDGEQVSLIESGKDVIEGVITVDEERIYEIISSDKSDKHELRLEFPAGGLELYAFTFG